MQHDEEHYILNHLTNLYLQIYYEDIATLVQNCLSNIKGLHLLFILLIITIITNTKTYFKIIIYLLALLVNFTFNYFHYY